jgi:hypothetical protein
MAPSLCRYTHAHTYTDWFIIHINKGASHACTHTHTHTHTHTQGGQSKGEQSSANQLLQTASGGGRQEATFWGGPGMHAVQDALGAADRGLESGANAYLRASARVMYTYTLVCIRSCMHTYQQEYIHVHTWQSRARWIGKQNFTVVPCTANPPTGTRLWDKLVCMFVHVCTWVRMYWDPHARSIHSACPEMHLAYIYTDI